MNKKIGIIGGSGFVGRNLSAVLLERGHSVCIISRRKAAHNLATEWHHYNPDDTSRQMMKVVAGCDVIINLVGILNKRLLYPNDFERTHVVLTRKILAACREAGVGHYLYMSALNAAPDAASEYLRTKGRAEELVCRCGELTTSIFQPSLIFGPGDHLLNQFTALLKWTPYFFPLACADALFAPVYVGDVAEAIANQIDGDIDHDSRKRIPLCGPEHYTLSEIVEYVAELNGRNIKVIELSDRMSRWQARIFDFSPIKLFSTDNYLSLQVDSICADTKSCPTRLTDLGQECLGP